MTVMGVDRKKTPIKCLPTSWHCPQICTFTSKQRLLLFVSVFSYVSSLSACLDLIVCTLTLLLHPQQD